MIGEEEKKSFLGLLSFFKENPVIFDIGSNKGAFTDIMLDEFGDNCKLYLFEPNEMLLNYTKIKYEYRENIEFIKYAAYKTNGDSIPFYFFENYNNELSSIYDGGKDWAGLPKKEKVVPTITIDRVCVFNGIEYVDCIKIDTEGADVDVIIGCKDLLKKNKVGFITCEYGGTYKRANHTFQEIINIANEYGYKIYSFINDNYIEVENFVEDYRFSNFIITKLDIHNYSGGWSKIFIENTLDLGKFYLMLEVGSFEGITAKYMAENMLNEGGRVIVVDPLYDEYVKGDTVHTYFKHQYQRFLSNTRGLQIELRRGESNEELPKLNALRFDFIYLDGDHYSPQPYWDCVWCFAICKIGGLILVDDYNLWNQDTKDSIDKFIQEFIGSLEIVINGYQLMIRKIRNQYNDINFDYYK